MPKIFEESVLAGMSFSNRIIRSATLEGMADKSGRPLEELTKIYTRLARGGVGAIITGFAAVQNNGRVIPNKLMLDKDEYIDYYRKILEPVKEYDTPVILQLAHGGGQIDSELVKIEAVAPSMLKYPLNGSLARAMGEAEIEEVIDNFVKAIIRVKAAGFDGVQLHAAHGYLQSDFLSPCWNRRKDKWGGTTEGRFQIVSDIMQGARHALSDYPILMKFNAFDGDRNGMTIPEAIKIAKLFEEAGGNAIEVSSGGIVLGFQSVRMAEPPIEAVM